MNSLQLLVRSGCSLHSVRFLKKKRGKEVGRGVAHAEGLRYKPALPKILQLYVYACVRKSMFEMYWALNKVKITWPRTVRRDHGEAREPTQRSAR